jgi:hypothetical protein
VGRLSRRRQFTKPYTLLVGSDRAKTTHAACVNSCSHAGTSISCLDDLQFQDWYGRREAHAPRRRSDLGTVLPPDPAIHRRYTRRRLSAAHVAARVRGSVL